MWRLVLPGLLLAALAIPADAQGADPFAGIFNDLKARWSAVANAESADACAAGPVPRMSFAPTTVYPDAAAAMADGMPQAAHASPDGMTLRSGDKLLQAQQQDIPFAGKQVAAAWMLTLRDANTGAEPCRAYPARLLRACGDCRHARRLSDALAARLSCCWMTATCM